MPGHDHEADTPEPSGGIRLQVLAWVADRPRTYAEAMDAWRTSCPRLSVWEDAVEDGLVRVEARNAATQGECAVSLTAKGRAALRAAEPAA